MCTCDYSKCRKDCACKCHEYVEEASARYYLLGQVSGLQEAQTFLLEAAAECFKFGVDDKANHLRSMANSIKEKAVKRRAEYDAKYKS